MIFSADIKFYLWPDLSKITQHSNFPVLHYNLYISFILFDAIYRMQTFAMLKADEHPCQCTAWIHDRRKY